MKKLSICILFLSSLNSMEQRVTSGLRCVSFDIPKHGANSVTVDIELDLSNRELQDLDCLADIENKDAVITINLNGNFLTELPENAFAQFENLKFLYLNNNEIRCVHKYAFKGLLYLTEVYIIANPIENLADELFTCFEMPTIISKLDEIDE